MMWRFKHLSIMIIDIKPGETMKKTKPNHKKEATHERIVLAASKAIRRNGYDGASVADIMKEAGLTHGGFYAHFPSREAMLVEAASKAGTDVLAVLADSVSSVPPQESLTKLLETYLSPSHINSCETGCVIGALGSETSRQSDDIRHVITQRVKEMVDLVARQTDDWGKPEAHERALSIVATMIGTLTIARAVDDPKLADAIVKASLKSLLENK